MIKNDFTDCKITDGKITGCKMLFLKALSDIVAALYSERSDRVEDVLNLYCIKDQTFEPRSLGNIISFGICTEMRIIDTFSAKSTSYYLYPHNNLRKTPLRLSNAIHIISSDYRCELMIMVDNLSDIPFTIKKGEFYFQICAPNLESFDVMLVAELSTVGTVGTVGTVRTK